jgi:hypothetical protein
MLRCNFARFKMAVTTTATPAKMLIIPRDAISLSFIHLI